MNLMRELKIAKVVLNIGVGEAGERLAKAENVLEKLSGCKPTRTLSKTTNRDLGIRLGMPIGCKVTLRGAAAEKIIKDSLWVRENKLPNYCFYSHLSNAKMTSIFVFCNKLKLPSSFQTF